MSYIGNQPVLNTSEFREEFAVTSNQTVFNTSGFASSADSSTLEVLRNGVLLGTADYTLGSDASTVTLANAAVTGDIIVIKGRRELTNGVQVTERRHEHTMGSGETTVTFPYPLTVSQTDVYLNGVKLGSSDFSINSTTKVVSFTTNPVVGDLVAIVSREPALTANSSLPVVDADGNNVLSESGGTVTLTADEANVGSNALVVDANGNVGIGTSSPRAKVDFGSGSGDGTLSNTVSEYQAVFEAPQGTGDYGRNIAFATTTTGISAAINAIDEGGGGATGLSFSTGTAASISERMRIDRFGSVGAPSGTNIYNASDQRLKRNITELSGCLQKVLLMRGVSFNWINDFCDSEADKTLYGLIAQELQTVDSNLVDSFSDNTITAGSVSVENPLRVNEKFIIPMLVESIKEQQTIIESQQSQIDVLTARIEALETTP